MIEIRSYLQIILFIYRIFKAKYFETYMGVLHYTYKVPLAAIVLFVCLWMN